MSTVYRESVVGTGKVSHNHFYGNFRSDSALDRATDSDGGNEDSDSETILKRKQAWAELEREEQEVKRNIRGLMKTAPETRVIDDPMLADRVRNVRYEPAQYNIEEKTREEKRDTLKSTSSKDHNHHNNDNNEVQSRKYS